ncbi:MAG TPA: 2'-5' RNA ligase family protein [Phycisphaerae bacterium]|jgi:2'-5' RNA ligase|nr:2'-5' RNA ligase family protein [Phycisphaerae bacterium]HOB75483.1 2'-5' RNA ligase family protein [Phycisphaerae bacterium]HOJ55293.1 2'-5' RNA ligase family protein [Phycisphaerae bacterium]HOL27419.1 2'-5' RNA ligase family protein [Phycisphaerae bacterium]HPP21596.1 2'-5' RNA ligase family protein [Phycisphaerae bacterium]
MKTHQTAIAVVPPEWCWEPIQAIRRVHDRQVRRWMPHINLVYPFRPAEEFDALAGALTRACMEIEPFDVRLAEFRHFRHGPRSFTLWLAPEPAAALARLQAALMSVVPDCDEQVRHPGGFTPHLSVGQVSDAREMERLKTDLQANWRPVSFRIEGVSLIWRGRPPDDVFRVGRVIPLGTKTEH